MSSDTCCPYIAASEKRAPVEPFRLTSFGDWVDDSLALVIQFKVWTTSGEGRAFPSAAPLRRLAHPHVEAGCLYLFLPNGHIPIATLAFGTAPVSPSPAQDQAQGAWLPDRAPFSCHAMVGKGSLRPFYWLHQQNVGDRATTGPPGAAKRSPGISSIPGPWALLKQNVSFGSRTDAGRAG
jgi:hypothetical protein